MDKIIKILKIIFLLIGIAAGLAILAISYFVYKGVKSGDLQGYVKDKAVESVIDDSNLSPMQKELLESGDMEGLVTDLQENLTQEQIDCAVESLGEKRANELMVTQDPTPQEVFILSKCL